MLQKNSRWLVFAPANLRGRRLPLSVRSVGCYEVGRGWRERPRHKGFLQLFWGASGMGRFHADGRWKLLRPGWVFIYRPGELHRIEARSARWHYCWVTFDHPSILDWLAGFGLTRRAHQAGPCPEHWFHEIAAELRRGTVEGARRAAGLAHGLLADAAHGTSAAAASPLAAAAADWMRCNHADPGVGIAELAGALGVHRSTLFRQFRAAHGLNPAAFLHNLRMQRGLALLRETLAPVAEVARAGGFNDPNYFARAVRRATGMSPTEFRNS